MNRLLKCIAIDDEPMALLVIEQFCRRKGGLELTTFSEPHIGLEEIRRCKPDLVFLDIQMNSLSGLEIADTLPSESCFIFTTAYAEYALEGFNLDAVDFLHKPFSYERFEVAVEKALRRMDAHRPVLPECLVVKQEYNNVSIPLSDILYVEALGNYVKIVRVSGGHVLTRTNLKAITDMFPDCECKGSPFFETTKIIDYLFLKKVTNFFGFTGPIKVSAYPFPIKTPCK